MGYGSGSLGGQSQYVQSFDPAPDWFTKAKQAETGNAFVELVLWGCSGYAWSGIAAICGTRVGCLCAPSEPEACPLEMFLRN